MAATYGAGFILAQSNNHILRGATSNDVLMFTGNSNQSILFGSSNTSNVMMMLSSNGFLGIGKSNPAFALDVLGPINFSNGLYLNGTAYVGSQWSNSSTNVFLLGSNVGLGTMTPQAQLHLSSNLRVDGSMTLQSYMQFGGVFLTAGASLCNAGQITLTSSNIQGYSNAVYGASGSNGTVFSVMSNTANDGFRFVSGAASNEVYRITGTGYHGINNSNPQYPLDVSGAARVGSNFVVGNVQITGTTGSNNSYPPAALTAASTTLATSYGAGTYVISASQSTASSSNIFQANSNNASYWQPGVSTYSSTTPFATTTSDSTTDILGNVYLGCWIQMQMPSAIILSSYLLNLFTTPNTPSKWYILGSTNGTNWNLLSTVSGNSATTVNINVTTLNAYSYFRIVLYSNIANAGTYGPAIYNWQLYGTLPLLAIGGYVGIGTSNPQYQLDVGGTARINSNLVVNGNTSNSINIFPPATMTAATTNLTGYTYGNGTYIATASDQFAGANVAAYYAFQANSDNIANYYQTASGLYSTTTPFAYNTTLSTTDTLNNVYNGSWLQIQMPNPIILTSYNLNMYNNNGLSKWYILGSTNGSSWNLLNTVSGNTASGAVANIVYVNQTVYTTNSYSYFRIVMNSMFASGGGYGPLIYNWQLYGTQYALDVGGPVRSIGAFQTMSGSLITPSANSATALFNIGFGQSGIVYVIGTNTSGCTYWVGSRAANAIDLFSMWTNVCTISGNSSAVTFNNGNNAGISYTWSFTRFT